MHARYCFDAIIPNEGREGDVITLEGEFPPKYKMKVIFGDCHIQPSLCFSKRLQCIVPKGRLGSNVPVFVIFKDSGLYQLQNFHYKAPNTQYSEIYFQLKITKEKAKKIKMKMEDSLDEKLHSKFQRLEGELEIYEIMLNNSKMYEIIPALQLDKKLETFENFLKEVEQKF